MTDPTDTMETRERLTQSERRDRSERSLIEAMIKIVAESGVSAATFESIGKKAGFSRGLVTQRFGSKEGLTRALIDHLHEWQQHALDRDQISGMCGLDALLKFVHLHCQTLGGEGEGKTYFMLLAAAVADLLETREAFAESHEVERALIRNIIERGQADGSICKDADADAIALMAGCSLIGIRMQYLIDPKTDIDPIRDALIESLRARLVPE